MRILLLIVAVLLLYGCGISSAEKSEGYFAETNNPELSSTPETTCDPCNVVVDLDFEEKNYIDLIGYDPYLADNVVLRAGRKGLGIETDNSTYQTALVGNQLYLAIKEGKLSVTDIETGEFFEYQSPSDFKALAEYSDCSRIYAFALTESGNVYEINVDNLQYLHGLYKSEDIKNGLIPLCINQKVSGLAVKDYKNIYSTCGTFKLYLLDSKGVERNIGTTYKIGEPTSKTAYVDYIRVDKSDQAPGTPESPVKYLVQMVDGTVRVAFDYNEFDLRIENAGLKNQSGKTVLASDMIETITDGQHEIYIVSVDGMLYSYRDEKVTEIGQCSAVVSQSNGDYPLPTQIILEDGKIIDISMEKSE